MSAKAPDAVVLLHAYPLHSRMWDSLRTRLAGRRVFAPDFPGFGSATAADASLDTFAEGVLAELERAGVDEAVYVGLSMGGYVAFRIFDRWPERVAGLVLADTRAGADSEAAAEKRMEQAERARREGIDWLPDVMIPAILGETTRAEKPEVVARVRSMMLQASPEGVANALLAMRSRPDSRELLHRIEVPVLMVVGEEDSVTSVDEARAIADRVQHSELKVIPGAGHLSNLENPQAFETAVEEFLERVSTLRREKSNP